MNFDDLPLFGTMKKRMAWHGQRQEVLSHNIANADTPGYRVSDLKSFKFREIVRREAMQINMDTSDPGHLGGRRKRIRDFSEQKERRPFETAPAGNAVILEEQAAKLNENSVGHKLMTQLYKNHINMVRIAIGKR